MSMAAIFTLTIFTSAFLLFLIQPMISKLLLPQLGGSPAVWNTAMMFFQILLLLGYLYTHFSSKWLGSKKQSVLHIVLLFVSLAWLPVMLHTDISFSSSEHPIGWVILSLFLSIGVPFFLLASNAPLIQYWIANTSHPHAKNPYFLYSASNVGSLFALLSYPFLIEPALTLPNQTGSWSMLFVVFILLILACAWQMRRHYAPLAVESGDETADNTAPTLKTKLYWIALAFAPSSLMLGLTTYITTDIAPVPLFWVVPLALYLVTFIFAFGNQHAKITRYAIQLQNIVVPMTVFVMVFNIHYLYIVMGLHVLTFFINAMVCHGTLSARKPSPKYLTEFYVWMSFGGMLGGIFNALIAPNIFTDTTEYYIAFVLCLLLRPTLSAATNWAKELKRDFLIPAGFVALLFVVFLAVNYFMEGFGSFIRSMDESQHQSLTSYAPVVASNMRFMLIALIYVLIMMMIDKTYKRPLRFTLVALSVSIATVASVYFASFIKYGQWPVSATNIVFTERNFFGVTRVYKGKATISMMHGTTTHGVQSLDPKKRLELTSYYWPLAQMFKSLDRSLRNHPYAVIGLGAGTSACAGRKGQVVDFYDIDPDVVRMAQNPKLFTYLRDCPTTHNIILGDGRLKIAKAEDKRYGLIVVDAFSSDAIPVHLLTREAIAIYKSKLADKGVIALHLSNRHLNLLPVAAHLADDAQLISLLFRGEPSSALEYSTTWVLLTADQEYYPRLKIDNPDSWQGIRVNMMSPGYLWTDNYSNILYVLRQEQE